MTSALIDCSSVVVKLGFRNISQSTVNNLTITLYDSTRAVLEEALASTALAEEEAVELEYFLYERPALVWLQSLNSSPSIDPNETEEIIIQALGKRGLVHGTVCLEYASAETVSTTIDRYSRRIEVPVAITVNAALELISCDFTSCESPFTVPIQEEKALRTRFIIVLEFRNSWINSLQLVLTVKEAGRSVRRILQSIQSGQTRRFAIDLPRILLPANEADSRLPRRNKERQFVVSLSSVSEALTRKAWWYRERILSTLSAEWSELLSGGRRGEVELRGIRLSERHLPVVEMERVEVKVHVTPPDQTLPEKIVLRSTVIITNYQGPFLSLLS